MVSICVGSVWIGAVLPQTQPLTDGQSQIWTHRARMLREHRRTENPVRALPEGPVETVTPPFLRFNGITFTLFCEIHSPAQTPRLTKIEAICPGNW